MNKSKNKKNHKKPKKNKKQIHLYNFPKATFSMITMNKATKSQNEYVSNHKSGLLSI